MNLEAHPHFARGEFDERIRRLRKELWRSEVDVALFDEIEAMTWLAGYGNSENRWRCVGVPVEGEPFFLIRALDAGPCRQRSWIADVPTFRDWEDPFPVLVRSLSARRFGRRPNRFGLRVLLHASLPVRAAEGGAAAGELR